MKRILLIRSIQRNTLLAFCRIASKAKLRQILRSQGCSQSCHDRAGLLARKLAYAALIHRAPRLGASGRGGELAVPVDHVDIRGSRR